MKTAVMQPHKSVSPLDTITETFLQDRGLVVVSNRGPVHYRLVDGEPRPARGSGGLVTAISSLSNLVSFTWVASALSEGDRYVAQKSESIPVKEPGSQHNLFVRYVLNQTDAYQKYYNVISNPFLWFVQHYMWDSVYDSIDRTIYDAWINGYTLVNKNLADATVREGEKYGESPVIMIQDYQLYLAAAHLRTKLPSAILQHFIHIPWPAPRYLAMLPKFMREAILASLCSCDVVGFQTYRDAGNFIATCEDLLPGAEVDLNAMSVRYQQRTTFARHYPISIDVGELQQVAMSPEAREYECKLESMVAEKVIVRVDRLDPTKNVLRGFKAYELLLSTHMELLGKVSFLAFLVPSRTEIVRYQRYREAVLESVQRINDSFGRDDWTPVHLFYEDNYPQAIAGMRIADVVLVNPVIDGMNLVAKEAPIVNDRNCALILSETVGAYEQLRDGVISVSPADVEGTANALYDALVMDDKERARRAREMRRCIEREDITRWLHDQLHDLRNLT